MASERKEKGCLKHSIRRTEAELVLSSLYGSDTARREAFSALVTRYESVVRALLNSLCSNSAVADELAQETFITAWLELARLREPGKFLPWVKQIAYRKFLHVARRQKLERLHFADVTVEPAAEDNCSDLDRLLESCGPNEKELLVLVYGFGFTIRELAEARDQPDGTIKSALSRAKARIRKHLEVNADG